MARRFTPAVRTTGKVVSIPVAGSRDLLFVKVAEVMPVRLWITAELQAFSTRLRIAGLKVEASNYGA